MQPVTLKLFRSTGYSSILAPGETRLALHPLWMMAAVSAWIALACNVALWRVLAGSGEMADALAVALLTGGASGTVLGLLGWRRTIKPAATLLVLFAALSACGIWSQGLPVEAIAGLRPAALMPSWANLLRWQVPLLLVGLAAIPLMWVWHTPLRRLPGPQQLSVNLIAMAISAAILAAALLFG